jgi:aminoglycoside 2'-N-acetyltransferase I
VDRPQAAGMVTRLAHTAQLGAGTLAAGRALMADAFGGRFDDEDWDHGLGGMHVLVEEDDGLVAHGALVLRRLLHGGRSLRCGYVEAVAVRPDRRGRGLGHAVMAALEELAPGYDLLGLASSEAGQPLYTSRGWQRWRGPTSVLGPAGIEATPEDDTVHVWGHASLGLDLDGELTCDWRPGDVW